jgi:ABC-type phosphate transport system substrate-binding protein
LLAIVVYAPAHAKRPKPEVIRLHGDSQSLAAVIFPIKDRFEKETGVKIVTITETAPLSSLQELDEGTCDTMIAAMSFEELNQQADAAGVTRKNKALTQHSMLYGDIDYRIIVHPHNPITALSDKQLRKIFSGSYENWDEIDGPNLPLAVVRGAASTGSAWVLADRIMDGEPVPEQSANVADLAEVVARVAATPGGVAIVPKTAVNNAVKPVQTSELRIKGPIILVNVGFPQTPVLKLIKFLRENGNRNIGF